MNILITGGAGFIGGALAARLVKNGHNITIADNLITGRKENIPDHQNSKFVRCNVNNLEEIKSIFDNTKFDYVFHYAALVGVERTLKNPLLVLEDIQGFKNLLDLANDSNVKRVFFSSSSEVYGEPVHLPQNEETTPLNSRLPYAIAKNVGESYFKSYAQEFNLDYTIFRFFNTYGPNQSDDFVMSKFIQSALKNEDITIYGNGNQTRTFCFIDDNIDATIAAMNSTTAINNVFNIGHEVIVSINELAETIIKLTHSKSKIIYLPALEEGDMTRRQPDITKMKTLLKRDLHSLEAGIIKVLEHKKKSLIN